MHTNTATQEADGTELANAISELRDELSGAILHCRYVFDTRRIAASDTKLKGSWYSGRSQTRGGSAEITLAPAKPDAD